MTPESVRAMASADVDPTRDLNGRPRLILRLGEPYEPPYRPPWYVPQPGPEPARPKIGGWVPEIQPRPPWWRRGIFTPLSPEARERKLDAEHRAARRQRGDRW